MQATDQQAVQPTLVLPEPSYARQVITTMAAELERTGLRRQLLTIVDTRRAFTVAVAARLHTLPTAVADEVSKKVAGLLPPPDSTRGQYAGQLRQLAEAV